MNPTASEIKAPGLARITRCYSCEGTGERSPSRKCRDCDGIGWELWHACVSCGDTAMWYPAVDDNQRTMACRRCGATWTRDDPRWQAQQVPDHLLPAVA